MIFQKLRGIYRQNKFLSAPAQPLFLPGDYPNAMEAISMEMTVARQAKDKKRIAHCNNILVYIYFKQENFASAEKYYTRYINLAIALDDSLMLAHAYGEFSDVYTAETKYSQAIDVLFKTIEICNTLSKNPGSLDTNFVNAWVPQYQGKAFYRLSKKLPAQLKYFNILFIRN